MDHPQGKQEQATPTLDPFSKAVRTLWLAGLGAVALAAEHAARCFRACVEKGQAVEPELEAPLQKARQKVTQASERFEETLRQWGQKAQARSSQWEERLERKLESIIERATQGLREELRDLRERLERLEQKASTPGAG